MLISRVQRDIVTSLIGTCTTSATALRHHGEFLSITNGRANSQALCLRSTCWKGVILRVYLADVELFDNFTTGFDINIMGSDKGVIFSREHSIQISDLQLLLVFVN